MAEPTPARGGARRWARAIDPLIFTGLFLGYLFALVASAKSIGYARDEGFYFHAASTYGRWFELLLSNPARALEPAIVDRFWQENHEHPALMKSLFWLSQRLLDGRVPLDTGTTLRLPAMVLSALGVATTFAFGRRCIGRAAGLFAALSFGLMPSVFHNSHLACFDMPIAALWLFVVYAYHRSLTPRAWGWALACAGLYGLALDTKHNSWLLPPAILAHASLLTLSRLTGRFRSDVPRARAAPAIILTVLLAPVVFYALWPWIWHDTWRRLVEYVEFHRQHVYYNIEYLGRTYFEPPFPRSYPWVMTLATVPLITLVLALGGIVTALHAVWRPARGAEDPSAARTPRNWALLWLLCIVASYFMWLLRDTPIFGGTKHWLSAYPFLALFAGQGFAWLTDLARASRARGEQLRAVAPYALGFCTLIGPLVMTWHSVPWGLSAYMPLVGGAPGAATLGLNRSFWGYTTGSVVAYLNETVGRGERVFLHDTAFDSFRMLQRDQRLRSDIRAWGVVAGSKFALYHHEQHMTRVEYMIWVDYGTTTPAHIATFDGVPMVWVYRRP
jgi:4-amino-4-deoxy-L-arabinose transferase-like glycosyltransferase